MKTATSLLNRFFRAGLRPLMASAALLLTAVVARADTWVQCLPCYGIGMIQHTCWSCNGSGEVIAGWDTCWNCNGTGNDETYNRPCSPCKGSGYIDLVATCSTCSGIGRLWHVCGTCDGAGGYNIPSDVPVDNPFANPDEDGVGDLGQFTLADRTSTVAANAQWIGIAVGIFVEPVDWVMTVVEIYQDPTNPLSYIGLIPFVPSGAGKLIKASVSIATNVIRHLPLGKVLKMGNRSKGLEHILRGHGHGTPNPNKGKFSAGMGQHEIANLLNDALSQPGGVWRTEGPFDIYEVVMPNTIGVGVDPATLATAATRKIRIVVGNTGDISNEIITAYPIRE